MNASSFPKRRAFAILSSIVLGSLPASAVVVVNTDFSADLPGMTFDGVNSGNTAGYGTGGPGDGSRAVHLIDTLSAAGGANSAVTRFSTSTAFSTANPGQSELQISFDMAVTSLSSGLNSNAIPRILIRNTADQTQGITFGFGVTAASNVILFAAKGDSIAPANAGLSHNFGTYDTTTFTNNDTNGFVRITLSLLHGGTTVNVSATQGATTLFSGDLTGFTSNSFSNTNLNFLGATGQSGTASLYIDNLVIQTVPEPGAAVLAGLAPLALMLRRKRG